MGNNFNLSKFLDFGKDLAEKNKDHRKSVLYEALKDSLNGKGLIACDEDIVRDIIYSNDDYIPVLADLSRLEGGYYDSFL